MTPLFDSLCDLAERLPAVTADFLQLESHVHRRFREDSVTDIIIASLLRVAASNATLFTPPEVKTGGDFDLLIHEPISKVSVQYRIQAKRLTQNSSNWNWGFYKELDHPHGSGKQARTLIRSSAREKLETIPLYVFYNPFGICESSGGQISGIQLADGRAISTIVRALVKARTEGKRPRWKRVEYLRYLFFPLSTILCPSSSDVSSKHLVIRPEASRRAVLTAIEERRVPPVNLEDALSQLPSELEYVERLRVSGRAATGKLPARSRIQKDQSVSNFIERAIGRRPEDSSILRANVKRPKLVLLSR